MKRTRACLVVAAVMATLALTLTAPAQAENLMKNPSFEQLRDKPTQFGQAFVEYNGWVYDQPGRLAVGNLGHTGKHSYEIVNGKAGKTRLQSVEMKLEPGRYRMTAYLRGLSIVGTYSAPLDVSYFDSKFFPLKVPESFGWTPLTYVFQVEKPIEKGQFMVGLIGSGWLWIDDLDLEKVDDSVELSKEPVLGKEEAPIASAEKLAVDAVHCPECQYLNNRGSTQCYACGAELAAKKAAEGPAVKVLYDFEDGKTEPFSGGKITTENAPQGKNALLAEKGSSVTTNAPQDWSGYDFMKFDVFNPSDEPVMMYVEVRDDQSRDYWTRVNYSTVVPPGKSTVSLPTDMYVGEKSRPGRPLISAKVNFLALAPDKATLIFDNIRLERLDLASVQFEGLVALDFGKPTSPIMPGYQAITPSSVYSAGRGLGWLNGAPYLRAEDGMQPDALFEDFAVAADQSFQVDLPNGKYHAIMNIDSPGGFWGDVQQYTNRKVSVNGKSVVDDSMNMDQFEKWYYRHAAVEDLPGLDTFAQYVQQMFNIKQFDFEVTDAKAVFAFKGDGRWPIALSALVIYPSDKADAGQKFWNWTTEQRKTQFNDYFKQVPPKTVGAKAPASGYVLFTRGGATAGANDGPRPEDAIPAQGLSYTMAKGEQAPITFVLQPSADMGEINLELSEFVGPKGAKLEAKTFKPGWVDYRITRVTMEGTVYTVAPRYVRPLPAPAAKVTRNFWIMANIAETAAPGQYTGKVTVKPAKGDAQTIPVSITVLPFALDPCDIAAGPWSYTIDLPWSSSDPKTAEWNAAMLDKCLAAIHDAGFTTVTGLPNITVKAANGKVEFDFTRADKEMKALREHGFTKLISSYGAGGLGYSMYGTASGPDVAAAKAAGFPDMESFLKAVYGGIEEHAKANNWLPVAWNLCDEPLGEGIKPAAENVALHEKVWRELGLKYQTFMGATSMEGADPTSPHYPLVKSLPMPSLNGHDEASIKLIKDAGHNFSFYNGGNRWTFGRYMKALSAKYGLVYRVTWHFYAGAGDPYYALDCREDDYCWFNTNAQQTLVPALGLLGSIQPGMNDYRYLTTLERMLKEKAAAPQAAEAKKVYEEQINLVPGKDRAEPKDPAQYQKDRDAVVKAILMLVETK